MPPFKSVAQEKWMFANHPKMARKWEKETPKSKVLPKFKHKAHRLGRPKEF
jgi:hypothetical protein